MNQLHFNSFERFVLDGVKWSVVRRGPDGFLMAPADDGEWSFFDWSALASFWAEGRMVLAGSAASPSRS